MTRPTTSGRGALALLCALLLALFCTPASAQTGTSSVRGTVTDSQGNVVPGATVNLIDPGTNTTRTQTSSEDGHFAFDLIPPGTYRVEAEAKGFKKVILTGVVALVAKPTDLPIQLEVGNVNEVVTVSSTSAEALINTQDATLGNNFVSQQITQLPLEARNVAALLTLQPTATREGYVAGAHADQANVTLDGVDINEAQTNQLGGATKSDDVGHILRPRAPARFVSGAVNERLELDASAHIKCADPFGSIKLVPGNGQQIDA